MNMHTFDEADFRTLFGFSHETYNEYSGIYSRLRENVNQSTKKITAYKPSKKNFKNTLIMPTPKKKIKLQRRTYISKQKFSRRHNRTKSYITFKRNASRKFIIK